MFFDTTSQNSFRPIKIAIVLYTYKRFDLNRNYVHNWLLISLYIIQNSVDLWSQIMTYFFGNTQLINARILMFYRTNTKIILIEKKNEFQKPWIF